MPRRNRQRQLAAGPVPSPGRLLSTTKSPLLRQHSARRGAGPAYRSAGGRDPALWHCLEPRWLTMRNRLATVPNSAEVLRDVVRTTGPIRLPASTSRDAPRTADK